jgi:hypothetical protein
VVIHLPGWRLEEYRRFGAIDVLGIAKFSIAGTVVVAVLRGPGASGA